MKVSRRLFSYLRHLISESPEPLAPCPHHGPRGYSVISEKLYLNSKIKAQSSNIHSAVSRRRTCTSRATVEKCRLFSTNARRSLNGKDMNNVNRAQHAPADDPTWVSLVDRPSYIVTTNKKHTAGLLVLALIPLTAFALGTWQVKRLGWKTELIARFEDRLVRDPLPLPPTVDPNVVSDFDYRRVYARGHFCHDQEMLVGPRMHEGENGYLVITPLDRSNSSDGPGSKILVCRGWIPKDKKDRKDRDASALPSGEVVVQGLLREPFKKNMFTPDNRPEKWEFYFPDIEQMAGLTQSQAIWIEETMSPDIYVAWDRQAKGIPIGRAAEVNLRNNHTQYIFTWYSLSLATSIMFWMILRRPKGGLSGNRVRHSREWS